LWCGLAVTVVSLLALLWLASAPPFSLSPEVVGPTSQTRRSVDVVISHTCPFSLELHSQLDVLETGGGSLHFNLEGWREKPACSELKLQVTLPSGAEPETEWQKRPGNKQGVLDQRARWRGQPSPTLPAPAPLRWVSADKGPLVRWTTVLHGDEITDAFGGARHPIRLLMPEIGVKAGFSSRALRFDALVMQAEGYHNNPSSRASAKIFFPNEFEVVQVVPEPEQRVFDPFWFALYHTPANAISVSMNVAYRSIATKKVEDFLVVIFTSLIGIGAAAVYQASLNLIARRHTAG
jgi:hypothetical protein